MPFFLILCGATLVFLDFGYLCIISRYEREIEGFEHEGAIKCFAY